MKNNSQLTFSSF